MSESFVTLSLIPSAPVIDLFSSKIMALFLELQACLSDQACTSHLCKGIYAAGSAGSAAHHEHKKVKYA